MKFLSGSDLFSKDHYDANVPEVFGDLSDCESVEENEISEEEI